MNPDAQTRALPRKVLLFSGHMIDAPDRSDSRFPPHKEAIAADAIAKTLAEVGAGHADLAICGGACGGDLLFAEAALARQLTLEPYLPLRQEEFLANSIDFADANWRPRFFAVKSCASLHVTPDELGPLFTLDESRPRWFFWFLRERRFPLIALTAFCTNRLKPNQGDP